MTERPNPTATRTPLAAASVRRRRLRFTVGAAAGILLSAGLVTGGYLVADHRQGGNDLGALKARAAAVMPFDLDATHHTFTKDDRGGVETVVVKDPADQRNIDLIRSHLQHEATQFAAGNFADSAAIHGSDMPGLQRLQASAGLLRVRYEALPGGARITYTADEADVIAAIHDWFDAQNHDHGQPGMGG